MRVMKKPFVVMLIGLCMVGVARGDFFNQHDRGWFCFEQKTNEEAQKRGGSFVSSSQILEQFRKDMDESKAEMIVHPSVETVERYLLSQNRMFKQADEVEKAWQMALLVHPELNLVKDMPISDVGIRMRATEERRANMLLLSMLSKEFKLLFFYRSECQYCISFAATLEAFAVKNGFKVAAVTLDGGQLERFPATRNDELVEKLRITSTPALLLYSEERGVAAPVAHGLLSYDLLERNVIFVGQQLKVGKTE